MAPMNCFKKRGQKVAVTIEAVTKTTDPLNRIPKVSESTLIAMMNLRNHSGYHKKIKDPLAKPTWTRRNGWHDIHGRLNGKGRTGGLSGVVVRGGKIIAIEGRATRTEPKFVVEVNLAENNLKGNLHESIDGIEGLEKLVLSCNPGLGGPIPSSICRLESIQEIMLSKTAISGELPANFGDMANLRVFEAYDCALEGGIPLSIKHCKKLEILRIQQNHLEQRLPNELCECHNLRIVALQHNRFKGPIPSHIGKLKKLESFYGDKAGFTQAIPLSIVRCRSLQKLYLRSNQLTGKIPSDIGKLKNLTHLVLNDNGLQGHVPSSLGKCIELTSLNLLNNDITGHIPSALVDLHFLQECYIFSDVGDLVRSVPKNKYGCYKGIAHGEHACMCVLCPPFWWYFWIRACALGECKHPCDIICI
jgi:hypothetical protein